MLTPSLRCSLLQTSYVLFIYYVSFLSHLSFGQVRTTDYDALIACSVHVKNQKPVPSPSFSTPPLPDPSDSS
jgi:hypothetical protein